MSTVHPSPCASTCRSAPCPAPALVTVTDMLDAEPFAGGPGGAPVWYLAFGDTLAECIIRHAANIARTHANWQDQPAFPYHIMT